MGGVSYQKLERLRLFVDHGGCAFAFGHCGCSLLGFLKILGFFVFVFFPCFHHLLRETMEVRVEHVDQSINMETSQHT